MDFSSIAVIGGLIGLGIFGYAYFQLHKEDDTDNQFQAEKLDSIGSSVITENTGAAIKNEEIVEPVKTGKYTARNYLMTSPEMVMYQRIRDAYPDKLIFVQVALNQLIKAESSESKWKTDYSLFGKISSKSIDFVICDLNSGPLLAIELDDKSHMKPDRMKADAQKNEALKQAGVVLHRFNVSNIPSVSDLSLLLTPST